MTTITNNKLTGLGENHPANGPLTTERLNHVRDVLQRNLQYSNGGSMDYIIADAVKAIDELLEVRKAEPVAYIRSAHKPDGFCFADGIHPTHRHQRLPLSTLQDGCYWKVTPLYAAPPAPVAIDERAEFNAWNNEDNLPIAGVGAKNAAWLAWQARARLGSPTAPVVPATLPCAVELKPGLIIGKGCKTETLLTALQRRADYYAEIDAMTPEERAEHDANIEAFKAMLPQPVPDERKAFEAFMDKRFGDTIDQSRDKNGDHGYMAWDMVVAWIVWQGRAAMLNGGKS